MTKRDLGGCISVSIELTWWSKNSLLCFNCWHKISKFDMEDCCLFSNTRRYRFVPNAIKKSGFLALFWLAIVQLVLCSADQKSQRTCSQFSGHAYLAWFLVHANAVTRQACETIWKQRVKPFDFGPLNDIGITLNSTVSL
jgi:hypothetical protein